MVLAAAKKINSTQSLICSHWGEGKMMNNECCQSILKNLSLLSGMWNTLPGKYNNYQHKNVKPLQRIGNWSIRSYLQIFSFPTIENQVRSHKLKPGPQWLEGICFCMHLLLLQINHGLKYAFFKFHFRFFIGKL